MSLVLLFQYLLLNIFRMLVHPPSGACDLLWIYFMYCISLVRCVLVLRCGSAGVVWYLYAGWGRASACIKMSDYSELRIGIEMERDRGLFNSAFKQIIKTTEDKQ